VSEIVNIHDARTGLPYGEKICEVINSVEADRFLRAMVSNFVNQTRVF
jgi:hypothetical protein